MQTKHLHHKHGGSITAVHAVGHETDEEGVPYWYFICDVKWDDGTESKSLHVMPDRLCAQQDDSDAMAEINKATDALNEYLRKHGSWLRKAKEIGDRLVHWMPKRRQHSLAI